MDTKNKCSRCGKVSRVQLCNRCRLLLIEMRLKKNMRQVVKGRVLAMDDVTTHVLKFKKDAEIEKLSKTNFGIKSFDSKVFTNKKLLSYRKKNPGITILVPLPMEFEIDLLLEGMCKGIKPKIGFPKGFASILSAVTSDEAQFYAKMHGLELNLGENFELTRKARAIHKDTVYSLAKTAKYLRDALQ
jgi:hypothetical protein